MSQPAIGIFAAIGLIAPLAAWWVLSSMGLRLQVFLPGPVDVFPAGP